MKSITYYLTHPLNFFSAILSRFGFLLPDKLYLKIQFRTIMGKKLNLRNPKTFNEKLQWLKLYDRKPEYTVMVDKYLVKDYVAKKIGKEYIIPTLGVWDSPDEIDFDDLPEKFVLKCNHNSGTGVCICKDKAKLDIEKVKSELTKGLKQDFYLFGREWPYKNVQRKIIAEQYLENNAETDLNDYKLMCFNGRVKCSFVCSERSEKLKVTFFDNDWKRLPFKRHYPASEKEIPMPINFSKMIGLAEILAKDIPFVRVDFYEVSGKIYFGELTFYPGCGYEEFTPEEWDEKLGSWIKL